MEFRIEKDVLGELKVPKEVYWGINTQFPIDIYQTGSGTQTNMNMNEVLANRANQILGYPMGKKKPVHPNDHINRCQSSNDVIPTTMHISVLQLIHQELIPSLKNLVNVLDQKIMEFHEIIKVGRTHLQDAVPIPLSLEFKVYKQQIELNITRITNAFEELYFIPIGGTAVGTGLNSSEIFAIKTVFHLSKLTNLPFKLNSLKAEGISSHNRIVKMSANMELLAISLLKMANDIRWMGSGPRAGLSELNLPQNEPGSSIMPGKINPTQSEALIQVCLEVIGNHMTITAGEFYGSVLDLNVCKPLMITNLLDSIGLISNAVTSFVENCLKGIKANEKIMKSQLENLLMIVTNLTPIIGYDKCSEIALKAYNNNKTIKETIKEMGLEFQEDIDKLLDAKSMAFPSKKKI